MMPTAEELFTTPNTSAQLFKIGTVSALFASRGPKITFDGETSASEKEYTYLASYSPAVDDRVLLAVVSGTYIVLGKIK